MSLSESDTKVLAVGSGKGGVGKSTVTVNLAFALHGLGYRVGILDADVYGFSIPRLMGLVGEQPLAVDEHTILPLERNGVKMISTGSFVDDDVPIIWRGPLLVKVLDQFLGDVRWGAPDFLLLDLPPGTGDIPLSVMQRIPHAFLLLVTTPQASASHVAGRVARMAIEAGVRTLGVLENMSYFQCEHGERYYIFGQGETERLARELGAPVLGKIPLRIDVREKSDQGDPPVLTVPEVAREFEEIAIAVLDGIRLLEASKEEPGPEAPEPGHW